MAEELLSENNEFFYSQRFRARDRQIGRRNFVGVCLGALIMLYGGISFNSSSSIVPRAYAGEVNTEAPTEDSFDPGYVGRGSCLAGLVLGIGSFSYYSLQDKRNRRVG